VIHAAVHRAPGVPRAHIHRVHHIAGPARAHPIATHYIRRPIACPSHEIAIASPIPGAAPADTPETLLAELAGPPAARAAGESGIETAALAPAPAPADDSGLGGLGGGGGPGGIGGGFPGSPGVGGPIVGLPPGVVAPPDVGVPPVLLPPDTPAGPVTPISPVTPIGPVIGFPGTPPDIGPGVPPDVTPIVLLPPDVPPVGGTPTGGVPEPSAWALMICGFGAVGAALRRRRLSIA
jgi:hypothetical protein